MKKWLMIILAGGLLTACASEKACIMLKEICEEHPQCDVNKQE